MLKDRKDVLYYILWHLVRVTFCNYTDMTMQLQFEQRWTHQ